MTKQIARMKHSLTLTAGHVNKVTLEVEKPWICTICGKKFSRRTEAETCDGRRE